jgi:hypothetical protein
MLSLILACCLVSACGGGGQELPLKDGRVCAEVPAEVPQKTDVPFLSLNKTWTVVLGVVLAVPLLVNVGLGWRLCRLRERLEAGNEILKENGIPYIL